MLVPRKNGQGQAAFSSIKVWTSSKARARPMSLLRKPGHEIVAQALAAGRSQADAYRAGGYVYNPANAHRLCTSPKVADRVEEIVAARVAKEPKVREMAIEKAALTDSWVIIRLKHTIDMAIRGLPVYDRLGRQRTTSDSQQLGSRMTMEVS